MIVQIPLDERELVRCPICKAVMGATFKQVYAYVHVHLDHGRIEYHPGDETGMEELVALHCPNPVCNETYEFEMTGLKPLFVQRGIT